MIDNWLEQQMPHVKYVRNIDDVNRSLYYLGGEENESLIVGKLYTIKEFSYSPTYQEKRETVYVIKSSTTWSSFLRDVDGKIHHINLKNFGDLNDVRDMKINKILK